MLPDELVKEVISSSLSIPFEQFGETDSTVESPFAVPDRLSSSVILTVCKQWLRVATPLLYHTIVLRSNAQASAFDRVLRANPEFARYIKRVRLEGLYMKAFGRIVRLNPDIQDFCMNLSVDDEVTTTTMVRTLSKINPLTFIVYEQDWRLVGYNNNTERLHIILFNLFSKWTNLKRVFSPILFHPQGGVVRSGRLHNSAFAQALNQATGLQEIHLQLDPIWFSFTAVLIQMAGIPGLKKLNLRTKEMKDWALDQVQEVLDLHPQFQSVFYVNDRSFLQLENERLISDFDSVSLITRNFDDTIWATILEYAMEPDVFNEESAETWHFKPVNSQRLAFVLVCKNFFKLGIPYLYGYPVLQTYKSLAGYCRQISSSPPFSYRTIALNLSLTDEWSAVQEIDDPISWLVPHSSSLTAINSSPSDTTLITWTTFTRLIDTAGRSLKILRPPTFANIPSIQPLPSTFFCTGTFTYLETLRWDSSAVTFMKQEMSCLPSYILSLLVNVEHRFNAAEPLDKEETTVMSVLATGDLPSLKYLTLEGDCPDVIPFLRDHGPKLVSLHLRVGNDQHPGSLLQYCPSLTELKISGEEVSEYKGEYISMFEDCTCNSDDKQGGQVIYPLKKIVIFDTLSSNRDTGAYINGEAYLKPWEKMLSPHLYIAFPALQEIQVNVCEWPVDEREIKRNYWPKLSVRLANDRNIKLTDAKGRHWIPRLGSKGFRMKKQT